MEARFDMTLEDVGYALARTHERLGRTSPLVRASRRRQRLVMALIGGIVFAALVPGTSTARAGAAVVGAAVTAILWGPMHAWSLARLRRRLLRQYPADSQGWLLVGLTRDGVDTAGELNGERAETSTPWADIAAVEETDYAIEIWTNEDVLITVVRRAFENADDEMAYADEARRLHAGLH
ncbi:MAG: hypothetical protein ACYTGR_02430 [Planctomycetota bacterium]|jgi:hypothetical protein